MVIYTLKKALIRYTVKGKGALIYRVDMAVTMTSTTSMSRQNSSRCPFTKARLYICQSSHRDAMCKLSVHKILRSHCDHRPLIVFYPISIFSTKLPLFSVFNA